ncbi:hypothetical protein DJ86_3860 [Bacillus cereus ATCC 4342]|uniref:hypothetical protein n=1 Tax=Bacillus tropicus TaxID=2026188 RepID=UPI0001A00260|nr:hypothetical protein [Bacillus tropicus]AJH73412.1 hypothetical protein BF35_1661 [Bacillus cereus ATCC 4342]EEK85357.1 hypothetical protein bcere0010_8920 [Bacillus cereus ATCC 4342]KFM87148.1 hypothetical protein DJ86_3860 [Bacillus cereus ATCC 4342]MDR4453725.1 hypothetical protein [Bacillus tropicus]QKH58929.1 hypothetical protein FOC76_26800 [Bacillus tropicus]
MKKISRVLSVAGLSLAIFGGGTIASAAEDNTVDSNVKKGNVLDVSDQSNVQMGEVLTFGELVNQIAEDTNKPKEEVYQQLLAQGKARGQSTEATLAATFRTLTSEFEVTLFYSPSVRFYCETNEWGGSFRGIKEIKYINMNRSSGGITKTFTGTVQANLEDANRIFYIVNGDFYNNGTTTVNGGVSITLGKSGSANFSASYASNHYKYTYKEGNIYF